MVSRSTPLENSKLETDNDTIVEELNHEGSESEDIIELVTRHTEETTTVEGIVIGRLMGFDDSDNPLVDFAYNPMGNPLPARSVLELKKKDTGRDVALMFESNDSRRPIVIGLMHIPGGSMILEADGEKQVIRAEKELLLQCGQSSILLREDGKIVIKGRDIVSRASRNNKIRGGSVHLN